MNGLKNTALLLCATLTPWYAFALDGSLGTTSSGQVAVSITIPALVQISELTPITLAPTSFGSAVSGNTTACIYSNVTAGEYFVTATSANATTGTFNVKSGANLIAYSAYWNNAQAATPTTSLTSGAKTAGITNGSTTSLTCNGTPNANFNVSFNATQVAGAPSGTYTDTVTLLITPA